MGVTKKRKAELPSLSAPHGHIIRRMTTSELQPSHVDRPSELIRHVWHVVFGTSYNRLSERLE